MDGFTFPKEEEITGEVIKEFINFHTAKKSRYIRLKNMYEGHHAILDQEDKPDYKPDNRLVVNFAKYIVDTFNGFFIGIPVKTSHEKADINDRIDAFNKENDMDDEIAELSKMCSIYGHAYEFIWQDEKSKTRFTYNSPLDMFLVYDDTIAQNPLFGVRYYLEEGKIVGSVYTETIEYNIIDTGKGLKLEEVQPLYYGEVPIIEYIENEERQSAFEHVETLINAYDKAISEKTNDVDYFSDAYMKILGAELNEEQLKNIRDNRVINLYGSNEADKVIVEFMEKPNADTTQENLINRLEKLIYQISMVANISDEHFGNAASGVSLEFKLQAMKNLALMKERKFKSSMSRRYKMFFQLPTNIPAGSKEEWCNIEYTFTRNLPRNISDEANTAKSLEGVVSKETQLKVLSIVDNVKDEIARLDKEKEENNSYPSFGVGVGDIGEERILGEETEEVMDETRQGRS